MKLYHYTCDHGAYGIRRYGLIRPNHHPILDVSLAWFTDLETPREEALGLTSYSLSCDRTRHRFEVDPALVTWWPRWARRLPADLRREMESAPGCMPAHWFVATEPVPVMVREVA